MTFVALLALPLLGAGVLAITSGVVRRALHLAIAVLTLAAAVTLAAQVVSAGAITAFDGVMRVDALSAFMVVLIAAIAALAAFDAGRQAALHDRRFLPLLQIFLFTMLLAVTTNDVGIMWVAVEGTTLATVLLVNARGSRESLEAAYKYVLIGSVGIALAFVGTILIYFGDVRAVGHVDTALHWTTLRDLAPALPARLVEVAFVFILVGYGTKAGLAPMHTWLPDAYSEAPAPVTALMSGVLSSVGLYAVVRFKAIVDVAAGPEFASRLFLAVGLASIAVAAVFLWSPAKFKRMLAYSSIEHLGLVSLGLGFGGVWGVPGALLHVANHAVVKSSLFLLAGRIRAAYRSPDIAQVTGLRDAMPLTARAFVAGMLALMGLPPFGLFVSELMIFRAGFETGHVALSAVALALVVLAFGGLLHALHRMLDGTAPPDVRETSTWVSVAPVALALLLLVVTGVVWPSGFATALAGVVAVVTK